MEDTDEDIELVESCFEESSKLSNVERSSLYFISGYITHKENIGVNYEEQCSASEFTTLVSRGRLSHPPPDLFDLSQYLYCFFKLRKRKCCPKIFLQADHLIYDATGCHLIYDATEYHLIYDATGCHLIYDATEYHLIYDATGYDFDRSDHI